MEEFHKNILAYRPIEVSEIPTIALYMDQVLGFLFDRIKDFRADDNDKIMTKTMINNYVKAHLIQVPDKKKYNVEHIKSLIMIYHFKNVISIKQIEIFLKLVKESDYKDPIYDLFIDIQKEEIAAFNSHEYKPSIHQPHKIESILRNIVRADLYSRIATTELNELIAN